MYAKTQVYQIRNLVIQVVAIIFLALTASLYFFDLTQSSELKVIVFLFWLSASAPIVIYNLGRNPTELGNILICIAIIVIVALTAPGLYYLKTPA